METNNIKFENIESALLTKLSDGIFDKDLFNQFVGYAYTYNQKGLPNENRFAFACKIWEVSFKILSYLYSDMNNTDLYKMTGLSYPEKISLVDKLYMVSNFFTYQKEMDISFMLI